MLILNANLNLPLPSLLTLTVKIRRVSLIKPRNSILKTENAFNARQQANSVSEGCNIDKDG
mgnify:CR=1 FL=1